MELINRSTKVFGPDANKFRPTRFFPGRSGMGEPVEGDDCEDEIKTGILL